MSMCTENLATDLIPLSTFISEYHLKCPKCQSSVTPKQEYVSPQYTKKSCPVCGYEFMFRFNKLGLVLIYSVLALVFLGYIIS
jgi:hypothetical protein